VWSSSAFANSVSTRYWVANVKTVEAHGNTIQSILKKESVFSFLDHLCRLRYEPSKYYNFNS